MHWLLWTGESIFLGMVHHFYLLFSLLFLVCAPSIVGPILSGGSVVILILSSGCQFCIRSDLGYFRVCSVCVLVTRVYIPGY